MPGPMRQAAMAAYTRRWASLVAFAAHRALAASLLELPLADEEFLDGESPPLHTVLADARWDEGPGESRLPLR